MNNQMTKQQFDSLVARLRQAEMVAKGDGCFPDASFAMSEKQPQSNWTKDDAVECSKIKVSSFLSKELESNLKISREFETSNYYSKEETDVAVFYHYANLTAITVRHHSVTRRYDASLERDVTTTYHYGTDGVYVTEE